MSPFLTQPRNAVVISACLFGQCRIEFCSGLPAAKVLFVDDDPGNALPSDGRPLCDDSFCIWSLEN